MEKNKLQKTFSSEVVVTEGNVLETDCGQSLKPRSQPKRNNEELSERTNSVQAHHDVISSTLAKQENNFNIESNKNNSNDLLQQLSPEQLKNHSGVHVNSLVLNNSNSFFGKKLINQVSTKNICVVLPQDSNTIDVAVKKTLNRSSSVNLFCSHFFKKLIFVLFSILFACSFAFSGTYIYLHMKNKESGSDKAKEVASRQINVVDWADWGAIEQTINQTCCPLEIVNWVVIHTLQQTVPCTNLIECSALIESYQHYYDSHFIKYDRGIRENFIIGGDEQIYIGRGWKTVQKINNVKIGLLMGNLQNIITEKQLYLMQVLINVGRRCGKVTDKFLTSWRCGFCRQYGDVVKVLDLAQEGIFRIDSLVAFVEDTGLLSRRLCQRGEERDQLCRQVVCGRHFNSPCVQCNTTSRL